MGILEKLNQHLGQKVINEDVDSRSVKEIVGDAFDNLIAKDANLQTKIHEIIWNIVKAKAAEGQSNDQLQGKKDQIVKQVYANLKATLEQSIGSVADSFSGK